MIKLTNVKKTFNARKSNEICVVNNMSLELPEKGMVAFFGKSGCGKTTLLNLIGGLDESQAGDIEIDGTTLKGSNVDKIRNEYIGYIFQNYNLDENKTVFQNVETALKLCGIEDIEVINNRVMSALRSVDLEKFSKRLPSTLSGGQQQRIAIARALVKCPRIILADEPTGNLDDANTIKVMDILKKVSQERLVILVTHEHDLVDLYCNQVIELVDGSIKDTKTLSNNDNESVRDQRKIYLGDMQSTEVASGDIKVQFYGEQSLASHIKIVEKDGKVYIYSDSNNVKFLDDRSELQLVDEKFVPRKIMENVHDDDLAELSPIVAKKSKMFTTWDSVKMGYNTAFKQGRFVKKMLIMLLMIFPIVLTLLVSTMYASISNDGAYLLNGINKDIVKVHITSQEDMDKYLNIAKENEKNMIGDSSVSSDLSSGNTYTAIAKGAQFLTENAQSYRFNTSFLSVDQIKSPLIAGVKEVDDDEIVITKSIAKDIINSRLLGYIDNANNLIGVTIEIDYLPYTIVGIADETSSYIYVSHKNAYRNIYDTIYCNFSDQSNASYGKELKYDAVGKTADIVVNYDMLIPYTHSKFKQGATFAFGEMEYTIVDSIGVYDENGGSTSASISEIICYFISKGTFIVNDQAYKDSAYKLIICNAFNSTYFDVAVTNAIEFSKKCDLEGLINYNCEDSLINSNYVNPPSSSVFWIVAIIIIVTVMTICIYLIMRTSLMSRVKEIGVYRAIGATKFDIIRSFFIEFLVLFFLTVFIGFILASSLIWAIMGIDVMMLTVVYLPFWLWLIVGIGLFTLSALCAMIPVVTMLSKTPAAILAKYDI